MGVLICILWLATFVTADYLTKTERDEVLYYHNYYRGRVNPSAADMMDMVSFTCFILLIPFES